MCSAAYQRAPIALCSTYKLLQQVCKLSGCLFLFPVHVLYFSWRCNVFNIRLFTRYAAPTQCTLYHLASPFVFLLTAAVARTEKACQNQCLIVLVILGILPGVDPARLGGVSAQQLSVKIGQRPYKAEHPFIAYGQLSNPCPLPISTRHN